MKNALIAALFLLVFKSGNAQITPTLVKDFSPGKSSTYFGPSTVFGNKYVFSMSPSSSPNEMQLWVADSKSDGVTFLKSFVDLYNAPTGFATMNGKLFFAGSNKDNGRELWVTDGTPAGTLIVKDIYPGTASGLIGSPVALYDKVYFFADDGIHGQELWISDGTAEGTRLFIDLDPLPLTGIAPHNLVAMDNYLYFTAEYRSNSRTLWKTDTSGKNCQVIDEIGVNGDVTEFIVFDHKLYFTIKTSYGGTAPSFYFCCTDGTKRGKQPLKGNVNQLHDYAFMNGKLYFYANSLNLYIYTLGEIWVTDGTSEGTHVIAESILSNCFSSARQIGLTAFKNKLYFGTRGDSSQKYCLWESDGTSSGTRPMRSFSKPPSLENAELPKHLTVANGYLYFKAFDKTTNRVNLWRSDGTGQGTRMIEKKGARGNISGEYCSVLAAPIFVCDSTIYYPNLYDDVNTGLELYRISAIYPENDTIEDSSVVQTTMEFYPNPAEDELNAYFIFGQPTDFDLVVVDVCGRPVKWLEKKKHVSAGWSSATYSVKDLREGVYMLHMTSNETSVVRKIVVRR